MRALLAAVRRSLVDCQRALRGATSTTDALDAVAQALLAAAVPAAWAALAYPSRRTLGPWLDDLGQRVRQLDAWAADDHLPKSVWISGLFQPKAFLSVVRHSSVRRNSMPADGVALQFEALRKAEADITAAPRDGAHLHGLWLDGARWDPLHWQLCPPEPRQAPALLPLLLVRAVPLGQEDDDDALTYPAPVFRTAARGDAFAFAVPLRSSLSRPACALGAVALLMDPTP
eukprot:EG_transcript_21940